MPSREKVKSALRMVSTNYRRHLWRNQQAAKIYRFATAVEKSGVLFADEKAMVREFKKILKVGPRANDRLRTMRIRV